MTLFEQWYWVLFYILSVNQNNRNIIVRFGCQQTLSEESGWIKKVITWRVKVKGHQSGGILTSQFQLKHVFNSFEEIWETVFVDYQMKTIFMKCAHFSSLQLGIFFLKLGKKSPRFNRERGRISAPEDTKKNP